MKKYFLFVTGLFLFAFINFSFAAITPFKWDKPKSPEEIGNIGKEAEAKKATISDIKGKVKVIQPDGTWEEVSPGSKIQEGDQIRTESGSAIMNFSDGSSLELGPNTSIKYSETEFIVKIELFYGKLRAKILNPFLRLKKKLEIRSGGGFCCAIRGTDFIMEYNPDTNITRVYLYEGILGVDDPKGETAQLNPGEAVTISGDGKMVLGKLDQEKWNQLTNEISLAETPEQTVQPSATKQETTVQPPTKTLLWFGLVAVLLGIIGVGLFIYRKKS